MSVAGGPGVRTATKRASSHEDAAADAANPASALQPPSAKKAASPASPDTEHVKVCVYATLAVSPGT